MNLLNNFELEFLGILIERTFKTRGSQYPNPAVGSMVIKNNQIIAKDGMAMMGFGPRTISCDLEVSKIFSSK